MGSIARVSVFYTDLFQLLSSNNDIAIYATVLDGKDIKEIKKPEQGILLIGNESRGIPEELLQLAGEKVTIPKKGRAESLNAAVATGIILAQLT
jgi:TrmH family RNA methyltransferase